MNTQTYTATDIVLKAIDKIILHKRDKHSYKNEQELVSIIESISSVTGADITERTNIRIVADAVKIYSYMAREYTNNTCKNIGLAINRNHSTISASCKNYQSLYKYDDNFRELADQCLSKHFSENGQSQPKEIEIEKINSLLLKCSVHLLVKIKNYINRQIENNG